MRSLSGQLAQLVEQRIENPRVRGSIPRLATRFKQETPIHVVGVFAFTRVKIRGSGDVPVCFRRGVIAPMQIGLRVWSACGAEEAEGLGTDWQNPRPRQSHFA